MHSGFVRRSENCSPRRKLARHVYMPCARQKKLFAAPAGPYDNVAWLHSRKCPDEWSWRRKKRGERDTRNRTRGAVLSEKSLIAALHTVHVGWKELGCLRAAEPVTSGGQRERATCVCMRACAAREPLVLAATREILARAVFFWYIFSLPCKFCRCVECLLGFVEGV